MNQSKKDICVILSLLAGVILYTAIVVSFAPHIYDDPFTRFWSNQ
jgi:hypothetical protein